LWQIGPCIHHDGKVGVHYYAIAGSILGSTWRPDWVEFCRILT
jgi:hypothetical protein